MIARLEAGVCEYGAVRKGVGKGRCNEVVEVSGNKKVEK